MSKIFVVLFLAFLVLPSLVSALDKSGNFESQDEQDRFVKATLKKMAIQMNEQTPMMLDNETQMSSVLALEKTINFTMRLVNVSSREVDAEQLKNYAKGNLNDLACKNQATKTLIDLGVSYIYIYFGNDNRLITRVAIGEYKCN